MKFNHIRWATLIAAVALLLAVPVALAQRPHKHRLAAGAPAVPMAAQNAAANAVGRGHDAVVSLLAQNNVADDEALLQYATVTTTVTPAATASSSGCWGQNSEKHTIGAAGVDFGWEKLIVGGFCWNNGALTRWGGDSSQRWSGFLYCWTNTSGPDDWWYAQPTWRRAAIYGELGGNSGFGCVGFQSDKTWMGYGLQSGHPQWDYH